MEFAQSMMAGAAGWPLNVILTPDLRAFFCRNLSPSLQAAWADGAHRISSSDPEIWTSEERERMIVQADKIVEVFTESVHVRGEELPEKEQIEDAADLLFQYGGSGLWRNERRAEISYRLSIRFFAALFSNR